LDTQRLKELYEAYGYAVHRRCLRMLGTRSDADDVLQNVFVRAMRYGHTFDGRDALGWLYRIADRQCIDTLKKNRRLALVGDWEGERGVPPVDSRFAGVAILGCDIRQIIRAAAPRDARTAILYYVDEMTQDEVAAEMGCSRKTVKKRLARFKEIARAMSGDDGRRGGDE
jgi:RNA polymerase sigma factor (sigma-70 family)